LQIAAGVTSVRGLGNDSDFITGFKQKVAAEAIGPRIVLAGLVDGPGPFKGPTNILADSEDEARKAIDFFASRGYEGVKIYSSIKPELVPFMTHYAHERGLRVSGHVPADFILADGDPTKNIRDIRKVVKVVKDGVVFDPAELYREVGVQTHHPARAR